MDEQRERLIELLKPYVSDLPCEAEDGTCEFTTCRDCNALNFAEYLLDHGVILPPCKVGDTVYIGVFMKKKEFCHFYTAKVVGLHLGEIPSDHKHERKQYIIVHHENTNSITHIPLEHLGKKAFIANTREEAERALKGE